MDLILLILSVFFTVLSAAILSYISIATMVGPWIAPAIVLASSIILKLQKNKSEINKKIVLIQTSGSIGGIIGISIGFSLPTLYFLDPKIFNSLISTPLYFFSFIFFLCISAGGFGIWLARIFSRKLIENEQLSFPVSRLIYKIIVSQSKEKQAKNMFKGFSFGAIICFFRDGILKFQGILPKNFYILPSIFGNEIVITVMPMLWAIGFITGMSIVFPLFIGLISRYLVLLPINNFGYFFYLSNKDFIMAFASGLILSELILGILRYLEGIGSKIKKLNSFILSKNIKFKVNNLKSYFNFFLNFEFIFVLLLSFLFLTYLKFSIVSQMFLLIFIVLATYQISYLAGKIGLVTFGRFATFIMIPMIMFFKLNNLQITMLCVFFNVCAAAASDLLFDYKVAQLCSVDFNRIHKFQWLGLIATSLSIGIFLWLLFNSFEIGSAELFAQRGKSRALLIQSLSFDWKVVLLGVAYGVVLKKLKISPTMVFGGILMPNSLTIGLSIGAIISYFTKKTINGFPFWSGVFAGESIWILFFILIKLFI